MTERLSSSALDGVPNAAINDRETSNIQLNIFNATAAESADFSAAVARSEISAILLTSLMMMMMRRRRDVRLIVNRHLPLTPGVKPSSLPSVRYSSSGRHVTAHRASRAARCPSRLVTFRGHLLQQSNGTSSETGDFLRSSGYRSFVDMSGGHILDSGRLTTRPVDRQGIKLAPVSRQRGSQSAAGETVRGQPTDR